MAGEISQFKTEVEAKAKYDIEQKKTKAEIENYDGNSVVEGYKTTVAALLRADSGLTDDTRKQALTELENCALEAKSNIEHMKRSASEKLEVQADNFAGRIANALSEQRKVEAERPNGVREMLEGVDVNFVNIASVPKVRSASNKDMQVVLVEMIKTIYVEQGKKAAEAKVAELKDGGLNNSNFEQRFGKVKEESGISANNIQFNVLNGRILGNLYVANNDEAFKKDKVLFDEYKKYLQDNRSRIEGMYKEGKNDQECYLEIQKIQTPSDWVINHRKDNKDMAEKTAKELGISVEDLENATKTTRAIAKQARENARDIHDYVSQYKNASGKALIEEKIASGKKLSDVISTMKKDQKSMPSFILAELDAAGSLLDEAMRLGSEKISSDILSGHGASSLGGRASADYIDAPTGATTSSAPKVADTYNEKEKDATEKRDAATRAMLEIEEKNKTDGARKKVVRESLLNAKTSLGSSMTDEESKGVIASIDALLSTVDDNQDLAKLESDAATLWSKAKEISEKRVATRKAPSASTGVPTVAIGDNKKAGSSDKNASNVGNGSATVAAKGGEDKDKSKDDKGDSKKSTSAGNAKTDDNKKTEPPSTDTPVDTDDKEDKTAGGDKAEKTTGVDKGNEQYRVGVHSAINAAIRYQHSYPDTFKKAVELNLRSVLSTAPNGYSESHRGVTVSKQNGKIGVSVVAAPLWLKPDDYRAWKVDTSSIRLTDEETTHRIETDVASSAPKEKSDESKSETKPVERGNRPTNLVNLEQALRGPFTNEDEVKARFAGLKVEGAPQNGQTYEVAINGGKKVRVAVRPDGSVFIPRMAA